MKTSPEKLFSTCSGNHLTGSLEKLDFKMNYVKKDKSRVIFEDRREEKQNEWDHQVRMDSLVSQSLYARYIKNMQAKTNFGLQEYFRSLSEDETHFFIGRKVRNMDGKD